MKISDYPEAVSLANADAFITDGVNGTKKVSNVNMPFQIFDGIPEMHKAIFRGINLGSSVSATHKSEIAAGTFRGLWLGDYWTIGNVRWRIVDFNYWLGSGQPVMTTNHLVIMPDTQLYQAKMNDTATNATGYAGSRMRAAYLATAKTTVQGAFGSMVKTRGEIYSNSVNAGIGLGVAWYDSMVDLPNEVMYNGGFTVTSSTFGDSVSRRASTSLSQLALFRLCYNRRLPSTGVDWLCDYGVTETFAAQSSAGDVVHVTANTLGGVRPVFAIG